MNKKEEKRNLDEQLRTMPKPNLKSEQKHRIQLAINEANTEQRSKRPISIMLAFTALFIFSLLIFTSINKYTDLASGDIRSDILLDNVIAKDKDEYQFEQIPWFTTKQELMESGHIPSNSEDVTVQSDGESIVINTPVDFTNPNTSAHVQYKFQYDLFIGGEYIISHENEEEIARIGRELAEMLEKKFPEPDSISVEGLSEESFKNGTASARWGWEYDNNHPASSRFQLMMPQTGDESNIIIIKVSAPETLPDHIVDDLIEKGHLPPDFNQDNFRLQPE